MSTFAAYARLKSKMPVRFAPPQDALASDPLRLHAWLAELPLANRGFALMRMEEVLRELNAAEIVPQRRLTMLEMLERAAAALVDDGSNEVREFFPMSAERMDKVRHLAGIEYEFALGYAEIICDLCAPAGKAPLLRGGMAVKALVRACLHQAAQLWQASRMHSAPPVGAWHGMHDLFRYAVEAGYADRESTLTGGGRASPRSVYIQALLHAFAKPNQFTQAQNRQLYSSLPVLASWCHVSPGHASAGMIAVHTGSDQSPPRGLQGDAGERWMLDIGGLLAQFDAALAQGQSEVVLRARRGSGEAVLDRDIVTVLGRVWRERTERGFPRNADNALLETEVGLSGLHYILSGNQDFEAMLPLTDASSMFTASWAQRPSERAMPRRARAEAVDRSRQGYRLRWAAGEDARARVGELIALTPVVARGKPEWSFGALRWLRADADAGIEAGVELLPARPVAVAVYPFDAGGAPRAPVRGLLVEADGVEASIFVAKPFARDAVALEVLRIDEASTAVMARPVRVAKFGLRDVGLYQKILLSDEASGRLGQA